MSTFDRIAALIAANFGIVSSCLSPTTRLNELGLDPEEMPDLYCACEAEFKVHIDPDQNELFDSVGTRGQLADAIDTLKAQRAA
jgi:acyl carrier protein